VTPQDPDLLATQRRMAGALVDRINNDESFRTQFQDNPEGALRDAGVLDEIANLNDQHREDRAAESEDERYEWSVACCVSVVY
jgi:putative modified peptide